MAGEQRCPDCGGEIPMGSPGRMCPGCLLKLGIPGLSGSGATPSPTPGEAAVQESGPGLGVIGPYRLVDWFGEGGMGTVYLAEQREPIRRRVALKLIKAGMDSHEVIARFEAERQALALMDHPGIAKVLDAGTTVQGRPYFVMELVDGVPLTQFCDEKRLGTRARLELFLKVCEAVQHAHQKGIIHRDLKPSNILVAEELQGVSSSLIKVKVIDFGIAKAMGERLTEISLLTMDGQILGTPQYMSPEQAGSEPVDTRTDIYALGVILYELLTGGTPLRFESLKRAALGEVLRLIREEEAERPSLRLSTLDLGRAEFAASLRGEELERWRRQVKGDLDWIVLKPLEKEPDRRYESVGALAEDLGRYLRDEPVEARPPSQVYRIRKFAQRNKTLVASLSIVASVLVAASVVSVRWAMEADAARKLAEDRLIQADAVPTFLLEALASADPDRKGANVTLAEVLEGLEKQAKVEFEDQPAVKTRILSALGESYSDLGLHKKAERLLAENRFPTSSQAGALAQGRAMRALADSLRAQGKFEDALKLSRKAYQLHLANGGGIPWQPSSTGESRGAFLDFLFDLIRCGRTEEARREWTQAREEAESGGFPPSPDFENLGVQFESALLIEEGNPDEATRMISREIGAFFRWEPTGETPTARKTDLLRPLEILEASLRKSGRLEESIHVAMQRAWLQRRLNGKSHPTTMASFATVSALLATKGETALAQAILEDTEEGVRREQFSPPASAHPGGDNQSPAEKSKVDRNPVYLFHLASGHEEQSSWKEAAACWREMESAQKEASFLSRLARLRRVRALAYSGGSKKALELLEQLRSEEFHQGVEGPWLRSSMLALADSQGAAEPSSLLREEALLGFYRNPRSIIEKSIRTRHRVFADYRSAGNWAAGRSLSEKLTRILESRLGETHPTTLSHANRWGEFLVLGGEYAEAERVMARTRRGWEAAGGSLQLRLWTDHTLGIALIRQGKLAEAENILGGAWEESRKFLAETPTSRRAVAIQRATQIGTDLAELHDRKNELKKAEHWREVVEGLASPPGDPPPPAGETGGEGGEPGRDTLEWGTVLDALEDAAEESFSEQPVLQGVLLSEISRSWLGLGEPERAGSLLSRAEKLVTEGGEKGSELEVGRILRGQADLVREQGDFEAALQHSRRAFSLIDAAAPEPLAKENPNSERLEVFRDFLVDLVGSGKLQEARKWVDEENAKSGIDITTVPERTVRSEVESLIASLCGDHDRAIAIASEILGAEFRPGKDRSDKLVRRTDILSRVELYLIVIERAERLAPDLPFHQEYVRLCRQLYGRHHPKTSRAEQRWIELYRTLGKSQEANALTDFLNNREQITASLAGGESIEASGHDPLPGIKGREPIPALLREVVFHLVDEGEYTRALEIFEESLAQVEDNDGLSTVIQLELLIGSERFSEAIRLAESLNWRAPTMTVSPWWRDQVLRLCEVIDDPNRRISIQAALYESFLSQPLTTWVDAAPLMAEIRKGYYGNRDWNGATAWQERCVDILRKRHGESHVGTLSQTVFLGEWHLRAGRAEKAETVLRDVLRRYESRFGDGNGAMDFRLLARLYLGESLESQERLDEARNILDEAWKDAAALLAQLPPERNQVFLDRSLAIAQASIRLEESRREATEAAKWKTRSEELQARKANRLK